jgi:hypothetical protein
MMKPQLGSLSEKCKKYLLIPSARYVQEICYSLILMFEVLPQLPTGVFVHFHDVFYPFEYPAEWLLKGVYWNEDYLLRAFLSYNSEWEIFFFNTYIATVFKDFLLEKMPLCLKNTGGSLYIRRTGKG